MRITDVAQFMALFLLAFLPSCGESKVDRPAEPKVESFDLMDYLSDLERLARLDDGLGDVWYQSFSSVDHSGINNDGFKPIIDFPAPYTRSWEYFDKDKNEAVLAEVHGAGVITRLRFARALGLATTDRKLGHDDYDVRIYVDDAKAPIVSCRMDELTSGTIEGFPFPLVAGEKDAAGGLFSNVAIPFRKYARVAVTGTPHFHAISILRVSDATKLKPFRQEDSRKHEIAVLRSNGTRPDSIGKSTSSKTVTVASQSKKEWFALNQSGVIRRFEVKPQGGKWSADALQHVTVAIFYDGEDKPRVQAPLGIFFGSGLHASEVKGLLFGRRKDGVGYCSFPMPFARSIRFVLTNKGPSDLTFSGSWWCDHKQVAPSFAYFSASYVESKQQELDVDLTVLDVTGKGRLVGMVEDVSMDDLMLLEGNARIFIDGVRTPSHQSDGHETWWGWAWYRGPLDQTYQLPTQGYTLKDKSGESFRKSFYRVMLTDFIPFKSRIQVGFEHGPINSSVGDFRVLSFFYHRDDKALDLIDSLDLGDPVSEKAHAYKNTGASAPTTRTAVFESREKLPVTNRGYTSVETSEFEIVVDSSDLGVRLVRLSDPTKIETPQDADIYVDREFVGRWFQPHYNPSRTIFFNKKLQPDMQRWLEDTFTIPAKFIHGKKKATIKVVARGHWSEFAYRVYRIRR